MSVSSAIQSLEHRALCSAAAGGGDVTFDSGPPIVTQVYLSSDHWSPQFKQYVRSHTYGSSEQHGFNIFNGGGGTSSYRPGMVLPWINVNQVTVRFSFDMAVEVRHLRLRGVNTPLSAAASVEINHENDPFGGSYGVATFTLAQPLRGDHFVLELDGGPDGIHEQDAPAILLDGDANGTVGGDFRFRFDLLPGDVNVGGWILPADSLTVRSALGTSVFNPGSGYPNQYFMWTDVDGSGLIDVIDLAEVRRRTNTHVPFTFPTAIAAPVAAAPSRPRPSPRGLFGSEPILG